MRVGETFYRILPGLLVILSACAPILKGPDGASSGVTAASITAEIVAKFQGVYSGCVANPVYPGYYSQVTVTTTGTTYVYQITLSASATCASRYYQSTETFEIGQASYKTPGDTQTVIVDFRTVEMRYEFNHPFYVGQNYCGYTNWVINVPKVLTGVLCPDLISSSDAFHTSFRAVGESDFKEFVLTPTFMTVVMGYGQSGDTFATRKTSPTVTIPKL